MTITPENPSDYGLMPDGTPDLGDSETGPWTPAPPPAPSLRELATEDEPGEEAGLPGQVIRVVLEDGTTFEVRTTNKDYIRWDKTAPARRGGVKSFQDAPFIFAAFLAWAAARRLELIGLTFDQFLDMADVVERQVADEVPPTR